MAKLWQKINVHTCCDIIKIDKSCLEGSCNPLSLDGLDMNEPLLFLALGRQSITAVNHGKLNLRGIKMQNKLIYIADDEEKIRQLIMMFLKKEGYNIETFSEGESLLRAFKQRTADMLIIDIMMPGLDGFSLCTEIRKGSNVPIIIISAKDGEADKIAGLMLGSDDYMTKPFSPVELVLRVKGIFKRMDMVKVNETNRDIINIQDIAIHVEGRYAICNDKDLKFTPMEFNLLLYLVRNKNKSVSREELLNKIWGFESEVDTRATDDTVKRIRKKLISVGSRLKIETLWGFGFIVSDKASENK